MAESLDLPTVSVLMGAYNYEQYVGRAIESALAQDYPPELMEIVVIDDGSTDSTARVVEELARENPGRIRLVRQANGGYIDSTNRAIAESRGEILALLDADDLWLPEKTRLQVEMLQADPSLGLVYSDMVVIDGGDAVLHPSHLSYLNPVGERCVPALLFTNFVTTSSIMVRASLRDVFYPVPAAVPYADWWIALRAAEVSKIDYRPEALALYRQHGANMTNGRTGITAVRNSQMAVAFQLYALRHLPLDTLTPDELLHVWSGVEKYAGSAVQHSGSFFVDLTARLPSDGAQADALLAAADEAAGGSDPLAEARLTLKALAWDPFRFDTCERLKDSVTRAKLALSLADPLRGARGYRVLVDARELLAGDDLMLAYADALSGSEDVTLIIDASELPVDLAQSNLVELVDRCALNDRDDIDLVALVGPQTHDGRQRMLEVVHAHYSRREGNRQGAPVYTPSSLGELRARAA
ncbi:MAG: glycosyltransferase [Solirubrobacterales bacterium]|nr:glycosyltransferase [Solirubrobacterales bacterium]